jgi:hypothetical protein
MHAVLDNKMVKSKNVECTERVTYMQLMAKKFKICRELCFCLFFYMREMVSDIEGRT